MAANKQVIRIESILGGQAPSSHFAAADQFRHSLGIDPSLPPTDNASYISSYERSGLLRPVGITHISTTAGVPMWIASSPKDEATAYVYTTQGSVYSLNSLFTTLTGVGDLNDGGDGGGNGMAYYDNYMYFARATTIARYGPLDGTPTFTDDYWVGTLGKTALTNTNYPSAGTKNGVRALPDYPNHYLHRHSDGKLYIVDMVNNQGTIHYIKTTKTTVEGDTDAGSTYGALTLGFGLKPMALESLGQNLAIALVESDSFTSSDDIKATRAKLAFWDTTSQQPNQITWTEYPDQFISSIKNVNGVLYTCSGHPQVRGFRTMKYLGGTSFQEVHVTSDGSPPLPGATDSLGERLYVGGTVDLPDSAGCIISVGLGNLSPGIFNTTSVYGLNPDGNSLEDDTVVTAVAVINQSESKILRNTPVIGWTGFPDNFPTAQNGIAVLGSDYSNAPCRWVSQVYKIGQPYKITKIRIPFLDTLTNGVSVTPVLYTDGIGSLGQVFNPISTTTFGSSTRTAVYRPTNLSGDNEFFIDLVWTGADLCTIELPITIEYELLDVDTAHP